MTPPAPVPISATYNLSIGELDVIHDQMLASGIVAGAAVTICAAGQTRNGGGPFNATGTSLIGPGGGILAPCSPDQVSYDGSMPLQYRGLNGVPVAAYTIPLTVV